MNQANQISAVGYHPMDADTCSQQLLFRETHKLDVVIGERLQVLLGRHTALVLSDQRFRALAPVGGRLGIRGITYDDRETLIELDFVDRVGLMREGWYRKLEAFGELDWRLQRVGEIDTSSLGAREAVA